MKRQSGRCSWIQKWERGSMTVEASVIVPCMVIVTAALLILTFFIHNRVYYQAAACESALVGNSRYVPMESWQELGTEQAETRMQERIAGQAMPGSAPERSVEVSAQRTEVCFWGQQYPMFSEIFSDQRVEVRVARMRPVAALRKRRGVRRLVREVSHEDGVSQRSAP